MPNDDNRLQPPRPEQPLRQVSTVANCTATTRLAVEPRAATQSGTMTAGTSAITPSNRRDG
jgi:hypothetical protein